MLRSERAVTIAMRLIEQQQCCSYNAEHLLYTHNFITVTLFNTHLDSNRSWLIITEAAVGSSASSGSDSLTECTAILL
jgi:hypothetical protein